MKRLIALLFALILLASCSRDKGENSYESSISAETEIIEASQASVPEKVIPKPIEIKITELGNPIMDLYDSDYIARTPNDIILFENELHVGSGEYTGNPGPISMYRFNLAAREWLASGKLTEDAILRFTEIENKLYTVGIDPRESWDFGNYYEFIGGEWVKNRVIPGGVHTFDMVKYDNRFFFAIGTDGSANAVVCEDGEGGYLAPDFIGENGEILTASETDYDMMRVYDIFVLDNSLYALKSDGSIYLYNGESFVFKCRWEDFRKADIGYRGGTVNKVNFGDKLFIAVGYFYCADSDCSLFRFDTAGVYCADVCVYDNALYLLTDAKTDSGYKMTVYRSESGLEHEFYEYCSFEYEIPAVSFAVSGNAIYFDVTDNSAANPKNGMILEAAVK